MQSAEKVVAGGQEDESKSGPPQCRLACASRQGMCQLCVGGAIVTHRPTGLFGIWSETWEPLEYDSKPAMALVWL